MAQHTIQIPIDKITYVDYDYPQTNFMSTTPAKAGGANHYIPDIYRPNKYIVARYKPEMPSGKKYVKTDAYLYSVGPVASGVSLSHHIGASINWDFPIFDQFSRGITSRGVLLNIPNNAWIIIPGLNGALDIYSTFAISVSTGLETSPELWVNSNVAATNKPYILVTYEDAPPLKPVVISPDNEYINNSQIIRLNWEFKTSHGGIQKSFLVQWRKKGNVNWTELAEVTSNNYCDVPADTFPNGDIEWRVKTTNIYDEESPYSDILTFYAIGQPATPSVFVTPSARPTVLWVSSEQQLWQLQILQEDNLTFDTGNMPGTLVFTYKIPIFLEDNVYSAKVRTRNEYGLWSDWGEYLFIVDTIKPEKPNLEIFVDFKHHLLVKLEYETPKALIYRKNGDNFILLAETTEKIYKDYAAASGVLHEYYIRAVANDDSFNDSDIKKGRINLKRAVIHQVDKPETLLELKYRLTTGKGRTLGHSNQKELVWLEGREYPVVEKSGFKESNIDLNYFILSNDIKNFLKLADAEVILYRDETGKKVYGTIGELQHIEMFRKNMLGYDTTLTIRRIDYKEGVNYA